MKRLVLIVLALAALSAHALDDALFVGVQDAVGAPGGRTVIALRTYSSRPVGQGTICMVFDPALGVVPPLSSLKGARVFGQADDIVQSFTASEQDGALVVDLTFASASASINQIEGPFAALYFDVSADAVPDSVLPLVLDLAQSGLTDAAGDPIPLVVQQGELRIRHASAPREVRADVHIGYPNGKPVTLSLHTNEPFRIGSGQVAIRYSNRVLPGIATLVNDPRYGEAQIKLDGYAGFAMMDILSSEPGFNELPGNIIAVDLEPSDAFARGIRSEVRLDPVHTHLFDENGHWINVVIEDAVYELPSATQEPKRRRKK